MEHLTWEYEGRCPQCGTEDIEGNEDDGFICTKCGHEFIVDIDLNEAIQY